jgi:flagellar hook-associated protein 3
MRISDLMISSNYLKSLNEIKDKIALVNRQILTGKKIEKPSDSPSGTSRLIRISDQLGQTETYQKNIKNSQSFLNDTTFALDSIQTQILDVIGKLTDLQNPINQGNLDLYADMIDHSLGMMVETANSQSDGKFIFGGTDYSGKPYVLSGDGVTYETATDTSGKINVRFSQNITQNINLPGSEVFGTIIAAKGNFDSTSPIGTIENNSIAIYDNLGNQYQFQTNFQKTAADTYQLTYDIIDGGGASVFSSPPAAKELVFNPASGALVSVNGSSNLNFNISVPANRINFDLNLQTLTQKNSASSFSLNANQDTNIFNKLKQVSDNLRNGIIPTEADIDIVEDFNSRLIGKMSEVGNIINQTDTIDNMLNQQNFNLQELADNENGVDVAKAIVDLQNQQYLLEVSQKLAATILPKSLLDYL